MSTSGTGCYCTCAVMLRIAHQRHELAGLAHVVPRGFHRDGFGNHERIEFPEKVTRNKRECYTRHTVLSRPARSIDFFASETHVIHNRL